MKERLLTKEEKSKVNAEYVTYKTLIPYPEAQDAKTREATAREIIKEIESKLSEFGSTQAGAQLLLKVIKIDDWQALKSRYLESHIALM